MSLRQESSRLAWLSATLAERRGRIVDLLRHVSGLGVPGAMKPAVFGKFLGLMDQVADEKDEETNLLSQIEAIEQKHRFLRDNDQLERADPDYESEKPEDEDDDECEHEGHKKTHRHKGLWWFLTPWLDGETCEPPRQKRELSHD